MSADVHVTHPTSVPVEALWPVMSGVRDWPSWLPTVDAVRPVEPERPDEVGASYVVDQPALPRATWTITVWEPGRSFTWEARQVGIRSIGTHVLTPSADGGGTIELGLAWVGPLAPLVRRVFGRRGREYVRREAQALERTARERSGGS